MRVKARWRRGNAGVCKTPMRRFDSGTRLKIFHKSGIVDEWRSNIKEIQIRIALSATNQFIGGRLK